jgi:UDP-N-acetylmuramyl pentapeptide phosphotransferase/UDP-N-acetylglucosamine-1-phosphate transferase
MIPYPFKLILLLATVGAGAFILSWVLNALVRPLLARHALARPNARSSHHVPVPQGGGLAVIVAMLAAAWGGLVFAPFAGGYAEESFAAVTLAAVLLAVIGGLDDIRTLPASVRILVQALAVGIVIAALPRDFQIVAIVPQWLERAGLFLGILWFVNLVNFMDGIDWMTVAETVSISGAMVLLALCAGTGIVPTLAAAALLGAILGFAPFNKPVATLFLGDVGSLPIGLLLAWFLLEVAGKGHLAAAILLPLYYFADATITLGRRLIRGERVWEAHRSHFYQRATKGGFTVPQVIARVAAVNLALVVLALVTVVAPSVMVSSLALIAGAALVGWLLLAFARGKDGYKDS